MNKKRPSWDEYFLKIVDIVASRGSCDRGRAGAVIVRDNQIVSAGYAGAPSGLPHCDDVGHMFQDVIDEDGKRRKHCVRTIHAEKNAIVQAANKGVATDGATMYSSMVPCWDCATMVVQSGIKRVVCKNDYQASSRTKELFRVLGVALTIVEDSYRY